MREAHHPDYPLTLFYAFKQAESEVDLEFNGDNLLIRVSTGWETMLNGLLDAGFQVTGTWPMRTERGARSIAIGTNSLASSIVLTCRPRPADAPKATRTEFYRKLRLDFSRYAAVIEADGSPMRVRTALALINQVLEEILAEQEAELDAETRWAVAWFEQYGFEQGLFGDAETLSKAKNVSVTGLEEAGIAVARRGKVRLLRKDELDAEWEPETDSRLTAWEATHHLIQRLGEGEMRAAELCRPTCKPRCRAWPTGSIRLPAGNGWPRRRRTTTRWWRSGRGWWRRQRGRMIRSFEATGGEKTMAASNLERVGKALELLNTGLKPFVERELQGAYRQRWLAEIEPDLHEYRRPAKRKKVDWDTQALLGVMWNHWNAVFKNTLGFAERESLHHRGHLPGA